MEKPDEKDHARTTDSRHGFAVYNNLLKDAVLTGPCQALVSDITYIRTDAGFLYLSLMMDAYNRAIVGYDLSRSLAIEGAMRTLRMAIDVLGPTECIISIPINQCARYRKPGRRIAVL